MEGCTILDKELKELLNKILKELEGIHSDIGYIQSNVSSIDSESSTTSSRLNNICDNTDSILNLLLQSDEEE